MRFNKFTYNNLLKIKTKLNYQIKTYPINFAYQPNITKVKKFNNLIESKFIPDTIYNEIINYQKKYSIKIDNMEINLYGNIDFKRQIKFLIHLSAINKFLYENSNYHKNIKISIYFSEYKKFLGENIISSININSGLSYFDNDDIRNIIIFRKEEWKKVFIHELIHCYNFDNFKFHEIKFIEGNDIKYEALTETIALILHSQLISHLSKINFNEIINNEIYFSIAQSNKLLKYWEIKNYLDFYTKKIKVKSSPFSYIILKTQLLINPKFNKYLQNKYLPQNIILNDFIYLDYFLYNDDNLRMTLYEIE